MGLLAWIGCGVFGHTFRDFKIESTTQKLKCTDCEKIFEVDVSYDMSYGETTFSNVKQLQGKR